MSYNTQKNMVTVKAVSAVLDGPIQFCCVARQPTAESLTAQFTTANNLVLGGGTLSVVTDDDVRRTAICEYCGMPIEAVDQQCDALDDGRCRP